MPNGVDKRNMLLGQSVSVDRKYEVLGKDPIPGTSFIDVKIRIIATGEVHTIRALLKKEDESLPMESVAG